MKIVSLLSIGLFCFAISGYVSSAETSNVTSTTTTTAKTSAEQELIDLFFAAAKTGQQEVITEFLKHGFPVDVQNTEGYTALMMATYYGHQPVVSSLLAAGANRCLRDKRGHTALMGAIVKAEWSIARQLNKQDCDTQTQGTLTTEQFAQYFGQLDKFKQLSQAQ